MLAFAYLLPTSMIGVIIIAWCKLRLGSSLWPTTVLACLLCGPLANLLSSFTDGMTRDVLALWPGAPSSRVAISTLLIGPREETLKVLFAIALAWRDPDLTSTADRLLAAVAVAIGFAAFENLSAFRIGVSPTSDGLNWGFHSFQTMPIHVLCSTLMAIAVLYGERRHPLWFVLIPIPCLLHSLWDNPHLAGSLFNPIATPVMTVLLMSGVTLLLRLDKSLRPARFRIRLPSALVVLVVVVLLGWAEISGLNGSIHLLVVRPAVMALCGAIPWTWLALDMACVGKEAAVSTERTTGTSLDV